MTSDKQESKQADGPEGPASSEVADTSAKKEKKEPFTFTDDGCRTEIRVGTLIILAAVFLWLWLGPTTSSILYFVGLPLILIGVPLHALDTRKRGRPGYPLKLGLVLTIGGALMWPDLLFREVVTGPVHVQPVAPLLVSAGIWMLLWWPVTFFGLDKAAAEAVVAKGTPG